MPTADSAAQRSPQLEHRGDRVIVRGALVYATVPALAQEGTMPFRGRDTLEIDLSGVERSDSAGVALLLEWYRQARRHGCTVRFTQLPPALRQIAEFCGTEGMLPLEPATDP